MYKENESFDFNLDFTMNFLVRDYSIITYLISFLYWSVIDANPEDFGSNNNLISYTERQFVHEKLKDYFKTENYFSDENILDTFSNYMTNSTTHFFQLMNKKQSKHRIFIVDRKFAEVIELIICLYL